MGEDDRKSNMREQINENLKRVYEDALNEEVPDRFQSLLEQLRKTKEAQQ